VDEMAGKVMGEIQKNGGTKIKTHKNKYNDKYKLL
jgi:hypothetical protein